MRKNILFLCILFSGYLAYPQISFLRTYGDVFSEAYAVAQTSDEGYIATGFTTDSSGIVRIFLIKTDTYGNPQWTKTFGDSIDSRAYSVIQTFDGGYAITGYLYNRTTNKYDFCLIRTNASGDPLWTKRYFEGSGKSVIQTPDGGFIITGFKYLFYMLLIRTDANGNVLWSKSDFTSGQSCGKSIKATNDNGYIIAGLTIDSISGSPDVLLVRTDSAGSVLWKKAYGSTRNDFGNAVAITTDSGFIICGTTESVIADSGNAYLIKVDKNGDTLWTRTYGGVRTDNGNSISVMHDGSYVVGGSTSSFGAGHTDIYVIRTDMNGDTLWTRTIGQHCYDEGYSVAATSDGGIVVAGSTNNFGAAVLDAIIIKLDSNGLLDIHDESLPQSQGVKAYPNPTNGKVYLEFPLQFGQLKTIEIYNSIGPLPYSVSNRPTEIDISNFASGLYFVVLTNTDNKRQAIKIIKQ